MVKIENDPRGSQCGKCANLQEHFTVSVRRVGSQMSKRYDCAAGHVVPWRHAGYCPMYEQRDEA